MNENNLSSNLTETIQQKDQYIPQNNMALASLIMGIIGIVSSCCCFGGVIFGVLGIVFAVLSRINGRFEGYSMGGLITSIIALVLSALAGIFYFGFSLLGS